VELDGPLNVTSDNQTGTSSQTFDFTGAETWTWSQCDPKKVAELLKLGPLY